MTEYKIVRSDSMSVLEERVNKELGNGWRISGGLVVNGCLIMQAMVRAKL